MTERVAANSKVEPAAFKAAARMRARGATLSEIAAFLGVHMVTVAKWNVGKGTIGRKWQVEVRAAEYEESAQKRIDKAGRPSEPPPPPEEGAEEPASLPKRITVDLSGFESPEQACDAHSMAAAARLIGQILDPSVPAKIARDSAKDVLALGGHSPVNKSVVITAPLSDPRIADRLFGVLGELKDVRVGSTALLERYTDVSEAPAQP